MKSRYLFLFVCLVSSSVCAQTPERSAQQDSIIAKYLRRGAWKYSYLTPEWQQNIDAGIKEDSTIAYLWQQKSMPLWKTRKYDLAEDAIEHAVRYDSNWIDYRAFCTCIFAKRFRSALADFKRARTLKGDTYVMDHCYEFYEGLCYLSLNKFDSAVSVLQYEIDNGEKLHGTGWAHYLDLFYLGVAYMETRNYDKALAAFDRSLAQYPTFSDAKYYKSLTYRRSGDSTNANAMLEEARENFEDGFTINEDNSLYELYPYQLSSWVIGHSKTRSGQ